MLTTRSFGRLMSRVVLALLADSFVAVSGAQAQLTKIFVASYGNDANDGSRGSPKRNFQAAHNAVAAGGQIVVLDTAGYGQLTISKSIAVTVPPGVNGFVTTSGNGNGVFVNAPDGDHVSLRGLIIEGGGANGTGFGILLGPAAVAIEDCTVRNFNTGILVSTVNAQRVAVHGSTVRDCETGVLVQSNGAGNPVVTLSSCRLEQNSLRGLRAESLNGGKEIVMVSDCLISNNGDGVEAEQGDSGGSVDLTLADSVLTGNGFTAVAAFNAAVLVRVSNCHIVGNGSGVVVNGTVGGQVLSRGNNTLEKNNGFNTFPGTYGAK